MKGSTIVIVTLVVLGWIAHTMLFTVDETEVAVVTRFGQPLEPVRNPGLNFKLPWPIDKVIPVDIRRFVLKSDPQELLTDDEKNIIVEVFLVWRTIDPKLFIATVQDKEGANARLRDLYTARLGAMVGTLTMEDFINVGVDKVSFHTLAEEVRSQVSATSREHLGIDVLSIQITGFTLPVANRASVINRMNAERARIAARYRSEGAEQALRIEAKAAAQHETILADAHAKSKEILGTAEAEALKILGDAYTKDPEFYRFIRSLESYEAIIGNQTTLFLDANSKLLKVLNGE